MFVVKLSGKQICFNLVKYEMYECTLVCMHCIPLIISNDHKYTCWNYNDRGVTKYKI